MDYLHILQQYYACNEEDFKKMNVMNIMRFI